MIVEWDDLRRYCPQILDWIYYAPLNTISVMDYAATRITQERYSQLYRFRHVCVFSHCCTAMPQNKLYFCTFYNAVALRRPAFFRCPAGYAVTRRSTRYAVSTRNISTTLFLFEPLSCGDPVCLYFDWFCRVAVSQLLLKSAQMFSLN